MSKLSFLLLTSLLVLNGLALFSCQPKGTEETTTAAEATTEVIPLIEEGTTDYVIVFGKYASETIRDAVFDLSTAIEKRTGVKIPIWNDERARTEPQDGMKMILIGCTSFPQSQKVIGSLPAHKDAFTMEECDGAIVFAANYDKQVKNAVRYYLDNQLPGYDAETKTLPFAPYRQNGETDMDTDFLLSEIGKYTVVYASSIPGMDEVASRFVESIAVKTGITLRCDADVDRDEGDYEILLGYTNRNLSQKLYSSSRIMTYEFVVERGCLQIAAGGAYSAVRSLPAFLVDILGQESETVAPGNYGYKDLAPTEMDLTEGADLRLMTANLLYDSASNVENGFMAAPYRMEMYCGILLHYQPDAVGMQEINRAWAEIIPPYLTYMKYLDQIEYTYLLRTYQSITQWEPIFYRSDRYTCVYSDYTPESYYKGTSYYNLGVASAIFASREDPNRQFGLVNSHWNWSSTDETLMKTDSEAMANTVLRLQSQYPNAYLFCTGDLNSHRWNSKYLQSLLTTINGVITRELADAKGAAVASFMHQNQYIDHIIGIKDQIDCLYYGPAENGTTPLTDHGVVFADVKLLENKTPGSE